MTEKAKFKWDDSNTAKAVEEYENGDKSQESLEAIGDMLGTSKRSVIGKLVQLGVYVKQDKPKSEPKDEGPSKKEILAGIDGAGFSRDGLDNANKDALRRVAGLVHNSPDYGDVDEELRD